MSFSIARADISTALEAIRSDWTDYPLVIESDNRDAVNYGTQENPFILCEVVYTGGEQLSLGAQPVIRESGQIILSIGTKAGQGVIAGNALLDFVIPYFERKNFSVVRTEVAQAQKAVSMNGWYFQPVIFEFYFDRF